MGIFSGDEQPSAEQVAADAAAAGQEAARIRAEGGWPLARYANEIVINAPIGPYDPVPASAPEPGPAETKIGG